MLQNGLPYLLVLSTAWLSPQLMAVTSLGRCFRTGAVCAANARTSDAAAMRSLTGSSVLLRPKRRSSLRV